MSIKRPYTIWLMGLSSSGKSTIAEHFCRLMRSKGKSIIHYDGDEVRGFFDKDLGFSEENRGRVVETLAYLAKKANDGGISVVVSALTAHQSARDYVKDNVPNLLTGYVDCPVDVCASRDPKGLYEKAKNGEIDTLIGYNTKYQPPNNPDIKLDSNLHSVEENSHRLLSFLEKSH